MLTRRVCHTPERHRLPRPPAHRPVHQRPEHRRHSRCGRRTQSLCLSFTVSCIALRTCVASPPEFFFPFLCVFSAQEMGLGGFIPPYMAPETTGDAVMRGVNYASGGGGILNQTGSIFVSTRPPPSFLLCEIVVLQYCAGYTFASIILLFGQQTEHTRSLSRLKNFHVNRRKIEK